MKPRPLLLHALALGGLVALAAAARTAASQHAVTEAIKRARFMALLPYVGE